jgi:hypothetical protein
MTELQLLERRIDAVLAVLDQPNLSQWGIDYWSRVLRQLTRKLPKEKLN